MNAKLSAAKNRMTVGLVKAELQVFVNYNVNTELSCVSRVDVLSDSRLLNAAASNSKYTPVAARGFPGPAPGANNRP